MAWTLINLTDPTDTFIFEIIPYPYRVIPIRYENRDRNSSKTLLIETFATKHQIEVNGDILSLNTFNELKRFFIKNASFYLEATINEIVNTWTVRPEPSFELELLSQGSEEQFKGKIIFEEV